MLARVSSSSKNCGSISIASGAVSGTLFRELISSNTLRTLSASFGISPVSCGKVSYIVKQHGISHTLWRSSSTRRASRFFKNSFSFQFSRRRLTMSDREVSMYRSRYMVSVKSRWWVDLNELFLVRSNWTRCTWIWSTGGSLLIALNCSADELSTTIFWTSNAPSIAV